ncbi:MAG TPA: ketopantoate reductase family protein [Syntrophomonadaceae bacterium]|nr:ketopantoate reductase family protein [Syntrophomonadaceae bacterium]
MMGNIEKVSIIGLGAMGSTYLSQILKFLPEKNVSVIAGGDRAEKYRTNGVTVNGRDYRLNLVAPSEKCELTDLLIFAVKFNQLADAVEQVRNHIGPDTIIISILNGISSEEIIGAVYGIEKVLYSISVGIDAVREGNSTTFKNLGMISFGEKTNLPGQFSPKVLKLKEFFERTQINYSIPEDMMRMLWWKFMVNVGVNQVSAVLRASYGVFQNVKEARELMTASMKEVINISRVAGINLTQADVDDWLIVIDKLSPTGKTSMLQDMEAARQTEVDIFAGTVVEMGQEYDVPTPVNKMLFDIIKSSEGMFRYKAHE